MLSTFEISGYLNNFGFCISKNNLHPSIISILREYFTVSPELSKFNDNNDNTDSESSDSISFSVFNEDSKYIIIPKFIANSTININLTSFNNISYNKIHFSISEIKYKYSNINIQFKGNLRDYQLNIIKSITSKFDNSQTKGGIISLSCGGGKTVLAIYLASVLKLKTLVIVHQEFLQDQWIERFKQFTDAKIGIIRQKKIDTDNKDIVIGMLHSIALINYDDNIFKDFGLVIYDETHHLGSRIFSKALLKTSALYTIGLSATPYRSDGLIKVVKWFIGDVIYKMEKKYDYKVLVKRILFSSNNPYFKEKKRWFKGEILPDNTKMISNIIHIDDRNNMIISFIDTLKSLGRKIFVFSARIEHLEILKSGIDNIINNNNEKHIYNTYFYTGSSKKSERKMAEDNGHIIFATYKLAEEGLDISRLDTIILATPIKQEKSVVQTIGRILRNDKLNDTMNIPLVIDICDDLSIYNNWTNKRLYVYNNKNWFIQDYLWINDKYQFKDSDNLNLHSSNILFDDIDDEDFIQNNLIIQNTINSNHNNNINDNNNNINYNNNNNNNINDNNNKKTKTSKSINNNKNNAFAFGNNIIVD
jgi:superfamily II DNA or RNA helicase